MAASQQAGQFLQRVGRQRAAGALVMLMLAILIARYSWSLPVAGQIERLLYDYRATATMEQVEQDDRILLLTYTEQTVRETGSRSPLDRDVLARALANLERLQPRAVGIDIPFDIATESDARLAESLRAMQAPVYLAYLDPNPTGQAAQFRDPDWDEVAPEIADQIAAAQDAFFQQAAAPHVHQVGILQKTEPDNAIRRWPHFDGYPLEPMAVAMAGEGSGMENYDGAIRYRRPAGDYAFTKIPIEAIADATAEQAMLFEGAVRDRYVLIGTELPGTGRVETTFSRFDGPVQRLDLHAQQIAQLLDREMAWSIPGVLLWFAALAVVAIGAATAWREFRMWKLAILMISEVAIVLAAAFLLEYAGADTYGLPLFGWVVAWLLGYVVTAGAARAFWSEKRLFVQGALGRYLPPEVADQIVANPDKLSLRATRVEIHVLFSDLEGFTKFSHAVEPEIIADYLNRYLEQLSEIVFAHGGTLDKFIGDAVVAFWGAPIAHDDDAKRALDCARAIRRCGEEFRESIPRKLPELGRTRVGVHKGDAVVGNFGGKRRIQFTALGDAMNTAARLESANKQLGTSLLVSGEAIGDPDAGDFRPLGRIVLSGRSTPVEVFEPVGPDDAAHAAQLREIYRRFDEGEGEAIDELKQMAGERPEDRALQLFIERLGEAGPGGNYQLTAK